MNPNNKKLVSPKPSCLNAYQITCENSLDEFLTNEVREFDSIHKTGKFVKVSFGGKKLFSFEFGEWLVVFSDNNIKNYNNDELLENFTFVV
jgi:hypothetical protein